MGFWDAVGDMAKKAGKYAWEETKAAGERSKEYKAVTPMKSDDELLRIVKRERSSSPLRAGAAFF